MQGGRKERHGAGKGKLYSVAFNISCLQNVGLGDCILDCLYCNQYKSPCISFFCLLSTVSLEQFSLKSLSLFCCIHIKIDFCQTQIYETCWRSTVAKKDAVVVWNRAKMLAREQRHKLLFEPRYIACCNQQYYRCGECRTFHKLYVEYT